MPLNLPCASVSCCDSFVPGIRNLGAATTLLLGTANTLRGTTHTSTAMSEMETREYTDAELDRDWQPNGRRPQS